MQKLFLVVFFSFFLLATGCFSDAEGENELASIELESLILSGGKYCSNGFIQLNSTKLVDFKARLYSHEGVDTTRLESKIDVIHNIFSNQYSYFISFGKIAENALQIELKLSKKQDVIRNLTFDVTDYDETSAIVNIREPGESAVFETTDDDIVGYNVSTQPNILIEFDQPINHTDLNIKLESVSDGSEIPCSIELTKNPSILVQVKSRLQNDEIYRLSVIDGSQGNIVFLTKSIHSVFQTLETRDNYLEILTSNYILGLSPDLVVSRITEFNEILQSATSGEFFYPGIINYVVVTSDNTLKLIDDFKMLKIKGQIDLSDISGIISADFDNNGLDEILIYNNLGQAMIYRLTNMFELVYYDQYDLGISKNLLTGLQVKDIDNNGYFDFVAGYSSGLVSMLLRNEHGFEYELTTVSELNAPVDKIDLCDLNRDSMLDVVVLDKAGQLYVFYRKGGSFQILSMPGNNNINNFHLHDLNRDGYVDIISHTAGNYFKYFENLIDSFAPKTIEYHNDHLIDEICFASGFTRNNTFELMIYQPYLNMIQTFSLDGESIDVDLSTTNKEMSVEAHVSNFKIDVNPNKILSADFNNDRLLDILVIADNSLTVYLQKFDTQTVSSAFNQEFKLPRISSGKVEVIDLINNAFKKIMFADKNKIVLVSTRDYSDRTVEIPLDADDEIVNFAHFNYEKKDYLAVLTLNSLIVGIVEQNQSAAIFEFKTVQTQAISADIIEIVDFNSDNLPDALLKTANGSIIMFSEIPDESLAFFQHEVEFPEIHPLESGKQDENTLANANSTQVQLYHLTQQGLLIDKFDISKQHEQKETQFLTNDFDHDGDDDIILFRRSNQLIIDILINNSNKSYKHDSKLSQKLTELVTNRKLRYVGMLDLDADSWSDIVFCDGKQELFTLKIK